jgi:hypothetical protein
MHFYKCNMYFTQSSKVSKERKLFRMCAFQYRVSYILHPESVSRIQYPASTILPPP